MEKNNFQPLNILGSNPERAQYVFHRLCEDFLRNLSCDSAGIYLPFPIESHNSRVVSHHVGFVAIKAYLDRMGLVLDRGSSTNWWAHFMFHILSLQRYSISICFSSFDYGRFVRTTRQFGPLRPWVFFRLFMGPL